jgi:hypothetical protein
MEVGWRALGLLDIFTVGRLSAVLWLALVLDIVIIDVDSLADLGIKGLGVGQARKGQQCLTSECSFVALTGSEVRCCPSQATCQ